MTIIEKSYLLKYAEEKKKDKITQHATDTAVGLGIGAIAGGISTTAVQPISQISNIKSTFGTNPNFKSRTGSYKDVIKAIYRGDTSEIAKTTGEFDHGFKGIKNFYKGLGAKLVQTAPQSAILLGLNAMLYAAYKNNKRNQKVELDTNE